MGCLGSTARVLKVSRFVLIPRAETCRHRHARPEVKCLLSSQLPRNRRLRRQGHMGGAPGSARGGHAEEEGWVCSGQEPFLGFLQEGTGRAGQTSLRVAGLYDSSRLWGAGAVPVVWYPALGD